MIFLGAAALMRRDHVPEAVDLPHRRHDTVGRVGNEVAGADRANLRVTDDPFRVNLHEHRLAEQALGGPGPAGNLAFSYQNERLREKLGEADAVFNVVKNRLAKRAAEMVERLARGVQHALAVGEEAERLQIRRTRHARRNQRCHLGRSEIEVLRHGDAVIHLDDVIVEAIRVHG